MRTTISFILKKSLLSLALIFILALTACDSGPSNGSQGSGSISINTIGEEGPVAAASILSVGRNAHEYILSSSLHPYEVALRTYVSLPDDSSLFETAGSFPVFFLYHGSGGLFKEPSNLGEDCTQELESNYQEMMTFLNNQGIAVVAIDSFGSRDSRFCEDNSDFVSFAPPEMDSNLNQVVSRLMDTVVAEKSFCALASLDCSRMARIGTSEGGTAVLVASHRYLEAAWNQLFDAEDPDNELEILTHVAYQALPDNRPTPLFVFAIAPGCGFYGFLPFGVEGEDIENLFYSQSLISIHAGTADSIPAHCAVELGEGTRQRQAEEVQSREGIAEANFTYQYTLYADAPHDLWGSHQSELEAALTSLIGLYFP
ncbi:MAG: hypothetical protein KDK66_00850 [Deltaproteobacteria bacterium]|nr:hypothetical protein [Deltaproteobacteria bacterium]